MGQEKLYLEDFDSIISRNKGRQIKMICPLCNERRSNKRDRSLSINTTTLEYHCHYCEAKGVLKSKYAKEDDYSREVYYQPKKKEYKRPERKIVKEDSKYSDSFLEYFKGRGISKNTLIAAGVTQDVEWFPQHNAKKGCIGFNYFLKGELINTKYRTREKDFKLISGAELILYNIDSIHPSSYEEEEEKSMLWCEGEIDCLTLMECGYKHCVSVPNGANVNLEYIDNYVEEYIDPLDFIYICVDNDRKGVELREELLRRFGREKCRIVNYPEPCKDINEVLMQYGKEEAKKCIENFIELKPDGIQELVDVETNLDYLYNHGFEPGIKIGVPEFDRLISFKTGLLHIVTGVPSHGKTYLLNFILSRLNILHDWKMAFFSPEFYPTYDHIGQMIETFGGKRFGKENFTQMEYEAMKGYVSNNCFWIDPDDTDINSVLERAKYLIKRKGIKILVIDPFNSLTDKSRGTSKQDEYISEFLQQLRWFARKYGVAVFLVMHPTKQIKNEKGLYPVCDLYSCKGASEIYDKADVGITAWRNELEDYCEAHITKVKFRHLGEKGHCCFKFNLNNGRFVSIPDVDNLKKSGVPLSSLMIDWDNSNYILDKLKRETQPQPFFSQNESWHNQETRDINQNKDNGLPFTSGDESCPF
jgi:twinkle protein